MKGRRLLWLSLGANLALVVALIYAWLTYKTTVSSDQIAPTAPGLAEKTRIIPVIRKQFFSWNEIESTNYDTYVANLRDIACPEETIRDIILADVNKLYEERKAVEEQSPAHFRALDSEREALLARLLGADWNNSEMKAGFAFSKVAFTDPLLNDLSQEVRDKVIAVLSNWSAQAVSDLVEAAKLEQQMRLNLAGILSPPQMEELLSRYSANAANLNNQLASLQYFNATPVEYRTLFRATDAIDLQIRLLGDATDINSQGQLRALETQREQAIKIALGATRYAQYLQLQDPAFRDALAASLGSPNPSQTAKALYEINQETAIQTAIVQADPSLTDTQRLVAIKQAELDQLKAQVQAQGHELPPDQPPPLPTAIVNRPFLMNTGDTLATLAQRFNVTSRELIAANPGVNWNAIKPGETVYIPTPEPVQPPAMGQ